jgi:hypothetical protein
VGWKHRVDAIHVAVAVQREGGIVMIFCSFYAIAVQDTFVILHSELYHKIAFAILIADSGF